MVIVLMGVCGCGKTTVGKALAEKLQWPFFDADQFHSPANVAKMAQRKALTDEDRQPWLDAMAASIRQWTQEQRNAILACSALKSSYRQTLAGGLAAVRFVHLTGSKQLLQQRMTDRKDHFMPEELLESQLKTLQEPADALVMNIDQPVALIAKSIAQALDIQDSATDS